MKNNLNDLENYKLMKENLKIFKNWNSHIINIYEENVQINLFEGNWKI